MEFKKIDDRRFQCHLDEDDLEDNDISLDDFFRNDTAKIHSLLDVILEEAEKDIGIEVKGGVMSMQLAPQPDHSILLTISSGHDEFSDMIRQAGQQAAHLLSSLKKNESNVIKKEDADESIKAAPFASVDELDVKDTQQQEDKQEQPKNKPFFFTFSSLEEVEEFAMRAPKTWGIRNVLYKDTKTQLYYLSVCRVRATEEKFKYICNLLSDYASLVANDRFIEGYAGEHFTVIIKGNAINTMKKYCG